MIGVKIFVKGLHIGEISTSALEVSETLSYAQEEGDGLLFAIANSKPLRDRYTGWLPSPVTEGICDFYDNGTILTTATTKYVVSMKPKERTNQINKYVKGE